MLTRSTMKAELMTTATMVGVLFSAAAANAQYTDHYPRSSRTEPVRESVLIDYGTPVRASSATIRYEDPGAAVTYTRTYTRTTSEPRVVYASPRIRYVEPLVQTRVYRPARRVVHVRTPVYYGHGYRNHYRPVHRHHYSSGHRYYRHAPRHYTRHRHHRSHGWGVSVGHGRGYGGHRRGGFSFYYNN